MPCAYRFTWWYSSGNLCYIWLRIFMVYSHTWPWYLISKIGWWCHEPRIGLTSSKKVNWNEIPYASCTRYRIDDAVESMYKYIRYTKVLIITVGFLVALYHYTLVLTITIELKIVLNSMYTQLYGKLTCNCFNIPGAQVGTGTVNLN